MSIQVTESAGEPRSLIRWALQRLAKHEQELAAKGLQEDADALSLNRQMIANALDRLDAQADERRDRLTPSGN